MNMIACGGSVPAGNIMLSGDYFANSGIITGLIIIP